MSDYAFVTFLRERNVEPGEYYNLLLLCGVIIGREMRGERISSAVELHSFVRDCFGDVPLSTCFKAVLTYAEFKRSLH